MLIALAAFNMLVLLTKEMKMAHLVSSKKLQNYTITALIEVLIRYGIMKNREKWMPFFLGNNGR